VILRPSADARRRRAPIGPRRRGSVSGARPAATHRRAARPVSRQRRGRAIGRASARAIHAHAVWFALGLGALHLALAAAAFLPTPHTGGDNAAYIALARSLLERHAYLSLYDPATPPHTQYPPLFPAVLALAMATGFGAWVQLKWLIALFSATATAFTFLWIRRRGRPVLAVGVALLLALSPSVLDQSHWVLSDVPFWCLTALALWGFERLSPAIRPRFAIAALAAIAAYFTRSAGLPLMLAVLAWLALRRRWNQLIIVAAVLLPLALLWYLRARNQGGIDYVGQFWYVDPYAPELGRIDVAGFFGRMTENAGNYVRVHLPILLIGASPPAALAASIAVLLLATLGWARRITRPGVAELLLPLYLGLLLAWPAVWSGERFLLPAMPLLLFYAGDALIAGIERLRPRAGLLAGTVVVAIVAVAAMPAVADAVRIGSYCRSLYRAGDPYPCLGAEWRDFFDTAKMAERVLPEDAVVLSRKPRLFYGLSGLRGRNYPMSPEPSVFFAAAADAGARYVVLDRLGRQAQAYLLPVLFRRPNAFCLMHATRATATALLGILPGAADLADATAEERLSGQFSLCGDEYWRSPDLRESVVR
jgi:hypothetical protein